MESRVVSILLSIPKGKVISYSKLAQLLGTSPRAVGRILSSNKVKEKIPCHRVVMKDGRIGGYRWGVEEKIRILEKEGVVIRNGRIDRSFFID